MAPGATHPGQLALLALLLPLLGALLPGESGVGAAVCRAGSPGYELSPWERCEDLVPR